MDQNAIIAHAEHTHERLSKTVRQFIDHSYTVNDVVSGRGLTTKSYTFGLTEQRAQRADKQNFVDSSGVRAQKYRLSRYTVMKMYRALYYRLTAKVLCLVQRA
mgnify:CR=1 FL=1